VTFTPTTPPAPRPQLVSLTSPMSTTSSDGSSGAAAPLPACSAPAPGSDRALGVIRVVQPVRIVSNDNFLAQGSYQSRVPGVLRVKWDNHFSYFAGKHLRYATRVTHTRTEALASAVAAAEAAPLDEVLDKVEEPQP
jgi:hypothetical protein